MLAVWVGISGASSIACFSYGGKVHPEVNCIVTKIDGHRLCMVEHHVPSNTRYTTETCEFIRVLGNVKIGDQIIIDADEWKGYPAKCYKSPGCGKVIVKKKGSNAGANAAIYTKLEDICRDGKRSVGKVAEIGGLFLVDCFPETIQFHTNQQCVTTLELMHSPGVYERLKPYEFKRNLKVRFRIAQTYIENNHIRGEFIAIASEDGQPAAGMPASQQVSRPQGPTAQGSSVQPMVRSEPPKTTTAASGTMGWRYVGKGDCPGMDVGGLTMGSPSPDNARCNPSFKGMTAVCWDGQNLKHYGSGQPQCTYKNISPHRCAGGGSPGHMYECAEMEGYAWLQVGKGDCTGRDVQPLSVGSPMPRPDLCNASFLNKTAVCWDGSSMKHWGSDKPQCTYKDVVPEGCTGGGTPGYIYRCVQRGVETSGTSPTYSTSQQEPGGMENIVQEGLQKGVQKGIETFKGFFK